MPARCAATTSSKAQLLLCDRSIAACAPCRGQLSSAVLLDHVGFVGARLRRCTCARLVGVFLSVCSCMLARGGRIAVLPSASEFGVLLICAAAGASLPVQAAINARLATHLGGASSAGAAVCLGGSAALASGCLAMHLSGVAILAPRAAVWVLPLWETGGGGLLGVSGIAVLLVGAALGYAKYFVLQLSGQLFAAVAMQFTSDYAANAPPLAQDLLLRTGSLVIMVCSAALVVCSSSSTDEVSSDAQQLAAPYKRALTGRAYDPPLSTPYQLMRGGTS